MNLVREVKTCDIERRMKREGWIERNQGSKDCSVSAEGLP